MPAKHYTLLQTRLLSTPAKLRKWTSLKQNRAPLARTTLSERRVLQVETQRVGPYGIGALEVHKGDSCASLLVLRVHRSRLWFHALSGWFVNSSLKLPLRAATRSPHWPLELKLILRHASGPHLAPTSASLATSSETCDLPFDHGSGAGQSHLCYSGTGVPTPISSSPVSKCGGARWPEGMEVRPVRVACSNGSSLACDSTNTYACGAWYVGFLLNAYLPDLSQDWSLVVSYPVVYTAFCTTSKASTLPWFLRFAVHAAQGVRSACTEWLWLEWNLGRMLGIVLLTLPLTAIEMLTFLGTVGANLPLVPSVADAPYWSL
ncbi:hypothetical protein V8E53_008312 [Lactarius tabidus]